MPGLDEIVNPQGQPVKPRKELIVIKSSRNTNFSPELFNFIANQTGCAVVSLPLDSEFMMREVAVKEMVAIHAGIHRSLNIPDAQFDIEELKTIKGVLKYISEKTAPGGASKENALIEKIDQLIKQEDSVGE